MLILSIMNFLVVFVAVPVNTITRTHSRIILRISPKLEYSFLNCSPLHKMKVNLWLYVND